jgi:hypothetical protein
MADGYAALGYSFTVSIGDAALERNVRELLGHMRECVDERAHRFEVDGGYIWRDGERLDFECEPWQVLQTLFSQVNRGVVSAAADRYALLHASAVTTSSGALVLPGVSDAGKSTLAASLVSAGLDYVTDEIVAIDPSSGLVEPYPRPISIDPPSQVALASSAPRVASDLEPYYEVQWQVVPPTVAQASLPRWIVFPRYEVRVATDFVPITRGAAVLEMAENSFNFVDDGRRWLPVLSAVVSECDAYRLSFSDLDEAVHVLMSTVGT